MQNTEIRVGDYKDCFDIADEKTFVYFDPPYRPISKTAGFTNYAGVQFKEKEQIELADFFRKMDTEKHAELMLSNSEPNNENSDDYFFEKVYSGLSFIPGLCKQNDKL